MKSNSAAFGPQKRRLYDYVSDNADNGFIDLLGCWNKILKKLNHKSWKIFTKYLLFPNLLEDKHFKFMAR